MGEGGVGSGEVVVTAAAAAAAAVEAAAVAEWRRVLASPKSDKKPRQGFSSTYKHLQSPMAQWDLGKADFNFCIWCCNYTSWMEYSPSLQYTHIIVDNTDMQSN